MLVLAEQATAAIDPGLALVLAALVTGLFATLSLLLTHHFTAAERRERERWEREKWEREHPTPNIPSD